MNLEVVEVLLGFHIHEYFIAPGARITAWKRDDGIWVVYFNGNELPMPPGGVAAVGATTAATKAPSTAAPIHSAARLEQYQLAPAKPK